MIGVWIKNFFQYLLEHQYPFNKGKIDMKLFIKVNCNNKENVDTISYKFLIKIRLIKWHSMTGIMRVEAVLKRFIMQVLGVKIVDTLFVKKK